MNPPIPIEKVPDISKQPGVVTPTQLPDPVFVMCHPMYIDNAIKNNPTMNEYADEPLDKDKFMAQWMKFYHVLAANSLVYLVSPLKGLQDQTFVNSFVYLPNVKDRDVIVLSDFVGEGRDDEEEMAGLMLRELGYEVIEPPFKFEGFPEMKWIDSAGVYLGGYGFRTDLRVYNWLKEKYGCNIIPIRETDEVLYHLDCQAFPIAKDSVLLCTEIMDKATVKQIEKVCNVIPVSKEDSYAGICNCLQCEQAIYNGSSLKYMSKDDPDYQAMKAKDENLQAICSELGLEITFFDLSELEKLGAKCSCLVTPLNVRF